MRKQFQIDAATAGCRTCYCTVTHLFLRWGWLYRRDKKGCAVLSAMNCHERHGRLRERTWQQFELPEEVADAAQATSERPLNGYDKKTMASDIHELTRQLGYTKINLVGHDVGLMVAYAYAAAHPDEARRLILLDAPIPGVSDWEALKRDPHVWRFTFHNVPDLPGESLRE